MKTEREIWINKRQRKNLSIIMNKSFELCYNFIKICMFLLSLEVYFSSYANQKQFRIAKRSFQNIPLPHLIIIYYHLRLIRAK